MQTRLAAAVLLLPSLAAAQSFTVVELPVQASGLVWDPVSSRIFASQSASDSVVWINPISLQVGAPLPVGDGPRALALSDDGQFLYVGLENAPLVKRVHLPSLATDLTIQLGSHPSYGPMYAEDLAVQPGNPGVLVVSRQSFAISPRHLGVAVFDGAVQRPNVTPGHTGSNVLEASGLPSTFYGYNNETSEFGLRTLTVDAQGIQTTQTQYTTISGYFVDIEFAAGVLYATNGAAVDPVTGQTVGTCAGVGFGAKLAVHAAANRIHFLTGSTLRSFDRTTFALVDTQTIPGVQGTPLSLVAWGSSSLAFCTSLGELFILTGSESCSSSWSNYCPALANSTGAPSQLALSGSLRISVPDTVLHCSGLPAGRWGTFLMSSERSNLPFGDGRLCVSPFAGLRRIGSPVASDGLGVVALTLPFSALPQIGAGTPWHFQFWHRDSTPAGLNLSNAATVQFCP